MVGAWCMCICVCKSVGVRIVYNVVIDDARVWGLVVLQVGLKDCFDVGVGDVWKGH